LSRQLGVPLQQAHPGPLLSPLAFTASAAKSDAAIEALQTAESLLKQARQAIEKACK
jgi:hypothetical protein